MSTNELQHLAGRPTAQLLRDPLELVGNILPRGLLLVRKAGSEVRGLDIMAHARQGVKTRANVTHVARLSVVPVLGARDEQRIKELLRLTDSSV